MFRTVTTYTSPPPHLLTLLSAHLPHSLSLLRRLQFTNFPGGLTPQSHILYAAASAYGGAEPPTHDHRSVFAAAYVDLSRGPETELWLYSSLEHASEPKECAEAEDCGLALLREVRRLRDQYSELYGTRPLGKAVFVGNLNLALRDSLAGRGVVFASSEGLYDKYLFRLDELPEVDIVLEEGMKWGDTRREDIPLVLSRTNIPRKEKTMKLLPSTAITLDDGTPIAWCFLGPDGSLASLHCEELYRGRGYAKAVAVKILRNHLKDYGDDGLGAAEVAPDNRSSHSVCKSLGGKVAWTVSWSTIDLDRSFPDM